LDNTSGQLKSAGMNPSPTGCNKSFWGTEVAPAEGAAEVSHPAHMRQEKSSATTSRI